MSGRPQRLTVQPATDPFRKRQVPDVAARFDRERQQNRRHADLAWLGALAGFSDHELRLLDDLGFLSERDRNLLSGIGRHVRPEGGP